jgi:hypothetical protein
MADNIVIPVDIDASGVVRGAKEAQQQTRIIQDELGRTEGAAKGLGRAFDVFVGNLAVRAFEGLTRAVQNLARRGIALLGDALGDARVQGLLDRRLETALRNAGQATDEWVPRLKNLAAELQRTTNFSNEQAEAAAALGLQMGLTGGQIENLLPVAADLATVTGRELDYTLNRLIYSARQGGTGLERYGIALTDVEKAALKAAPAQQRVAMMAEMVEKRVGGMGTTLADPFVQLRNATDDLRKEMGEGFLPVANEVAERLRDIAGDPAVQEFVRNTARMLANALQRSIDLMLSFAKTMRDWQRGIRRTGSVLVSLVGTVVSYRVATTAAFGATRLYALWLGRAAAAKVAATVAQRALNLAMRANP